MKNYIGKFKPKGRKTIAAGLMLLSMTSFASAASYMNIDTYRANESAFSQSASSSAFIAGKWKDAEATISSEIARIRNNMAKPDDTEEQKKNKYKNLNEVIESPLSKTGTVDEKYKDAHGHAYITASGSTSSGSFSEQGFATGNLSKGSKEVLFENRYGNATSGGYTFDYIMFTKKTTNEDGSWNAQSRLVIGDSAHPQFQTYYATITARGSASGEVHEFTRGIAIDVNRNIRNVEQSIVYHVNGDNKQLYTMMGSGTNPAEESAMIDFSINGEDMSYGITTDDNDIQQQCLNDGIDVSQCAIPSFLKEYAKLKKEENAEGIAKLTSGIIEKDALAEADDSNVNNLFSETTGKMAAAGVVTLGAALGCYSVLRRKPEDEEGSEEGGGEAAAAGIKLDSDKSVLTPEQKAKMEKLSEKVLSMDNPEDADVYEVFDESDGINFKEVAKAQAVAIGAAGLIVAAACAAPLMAGSATVGTAIASTAARGIPIVSPIAGKASQYLSRGASPAAVSEAESVVAKEAPAFQAEATAVQEALANGGSFPKGLFSKPVANEATSAAGKGAAQTTARTGEKAASSAESKVAQSAAETETKAISKNVSKMDKINQEIKNAKDGLNQATTIAERNKFQKQLDNANKQKGLLQAKGSLSSGSIKDYWDVFTYALQNKALITKEVTKNIYGRVFPK